MTRHILVYGGAVLLIIGVFFGAKLYGESAQQNLKKTRDASLSEAQAAENTKARVKVCQVFPQPLTDILKLPGTIEAYEDIDLATRMAGNVTWIGPKEGDRVRKGEKLLQLDVEAFKAQLSQARASQELADQKFQRMQKLRKDDVVSADQFEDAETALKTAKSTLDVAQVNLDYGTLLSPIDGVLDRKSIDVGEHVDAGKTAMKIVDIDRVKVVLNIPEKDALYFKPGRQVKISFSNGKAFETTGTIEFLAMTAEEATRTYPMKVVVENPEHQLRPGMIVRAELVRRRLDKAFAVPFFTILTREKSHTVYVVENGVARERPIEYGVIQGGMVEIVSGLREGDRLVVVGQRDLVDGAPVEIAGDLTELARKFIAAGGDVSQLALEASLGTLDAANSPTAAATPGRASAEPSNKTE